MLAVQQVIIIGQGIVGGLLALELEANAAVTILSARSLLAGTALSQLRALLASGTRIVFAHGREISARTFVRDYNELLASRIEPLELVASEVNRLGIAVKPILISSTIAWLPADHAAEDTLVSLQHRFEAKFKVLYARHGCCIVRAGALLDPDGQISRRLARLKRTLLLKYLRPTSRTSIPWTDRRCLRDVLQRACASDSPEIMTSMHRQGFDLGTLFDRALGTAFSVRVPDELFWKIWWLLGVRREFLQISVRDVLRSHRLTRARSSQ